MRMIRHLLGAVALVAACQTHVAAQDLLRGGRLADPNNFEQRQRDRVDRERQDQLFQQEIQRRNLQNQYLERQLNAPPPTVYVPQGSGYAMPPTYVPPGYGGGGVYVPQQPACRQYVPTYDAYGRFIGNACVQ